MAVLRSSLVAQLHDRVSGPARGIHGTLRGLRRAGDRFTQTQTRMGAPLLSSTRGLIGMGLSYLGLRAGLDSTTGASMRFQTAMADVEKKTTLTRVELERTKKTIRELSNAKGGRTMTEIAKLYAQAGQFGIANKELDRFVKLGGKASVAFDMSAENTANSLSQLKNALGLDMTGLEGLADAINYSADTAGTSEKSLIDFLLRTAATAKSFGISGQEMAAFGATLNEIGIESAKAGTGMNAMMIKMSALSKNKKAVKALDALGGKGYSASLQKKFFKTPVDAMRDFFKVVKDMDAQTRSGLLLDFFGLEYQDDATAIANNIDKIVGRLETLRNTSSFAGSVDKTFEIFANTAEEKLKRLQRIAANGGAALGSKILPPIVEFAEKLSSTLTTLDSRVTVFDTLEARAKGFMTGLGFDAGEGLGSAFNQAWDAIFGRTEDLAADTEKMGAAFERMRQMGAGLRSFVGDLTALAGSIADFLGVDHDAAGAAFASLAGYGGGLALAALGIGLVVRPIRMLGNALLFLSGIKPAWGLLRFLGRLTKLGAGAAGIGALAKATGALGKSAEALPKAGPSSKGRPGIGTVGKNSPLNGRIAPKDLGKMGKRLNAAQKPTTASPGGRLTFLKNLKSAAAGAIATSAFLSFIDSLGAAVGHGVTAEGQANFTKNMADPEIRERFNPMKGVGVFQDMEKRLAPDGVKDVSLVGKPAVTVSGEPVVVTKPSGVQEVRVTNQAPPSITVHAPITVYEATNAAQISGELASEVREQMSGIQADIESAGP
ncbi:phage tail tape measure protein [Roseibium sp.]|uniref:phage tail tape measure protein n=1 Tax=Roseibium sp. TaxID=1936156 RepID=UPI003B52C0F2